MATKGDPEGYYRALGVPRTASADEIRHAFRARAMASHPDRAGETADGETFRLVREAYEVLRDPLRRMAYDASGLAGFEPADRPGRGHAGTDDAGEAAPGAGTWRAGGRSAGRAQEANGGARAEAAAAGGETAASAGKNWARDAAAGAAWATGFRPRHQGSVGTSTKRGRSGTKRGRTGRPGLWLTLTAAGLALALMLALGALWSVNRQLADREAVLAEAYDRLARSGEARADLLTRYRSLAFLDLERVLQRGDRLPYGALPADPVEDPDRAGIAADWGRAAYLQEIAFPGGRFDLGLDQEQALARALVDIADLIDRLPADADWLIVLESQAARAAFGEQVAVAVWEPALLRLGTVLEAMLARGLPSERFAIRFNAGFAALPRAGENGLDAVFDRVLIKLVCCGP